MKILFVAGNIYPDDNANSNIVKALAAEMSDKGHDIDILGKSDINGTPYQKKGEFYYELTALNNINTDFAKKTNVCKKALYLLLHPKELCFIIRMRLSKQYVEKQYVKCCKNRIEQLYNKKHYDAVISVSMPIWTAAALASVKVNTVKAEYRLDPYAYNQLENSISFEEKLDIEKKILDNVHIAFLPVTDYKDMCENKELKDYQVKLNPVEFPNLVKHEHYETKLSRKIKKEAFTFVYLGYMYQDIRNPKYMLDFFVRLEKDIDFRLYIIGGGCESILEEYKKILGVKLNVISRVSANESYSIMNSADYLINVGNTVLNMVPSKIIDYISTGKPILNFVKDNNCPTFSYLKRYGNAISVVDYEWEKNYNMLRDFIQNSKTRIEYESVQQIFFKNTPSFCSDLILNKITEYKLKESTK